MLEKRVEQQLVKQVKAKGGLCLKLNSQSMSGIPDRLVLLPPGKIGFVEVKQKGKKPRPLQIRRMKQLMELGFYCSLMDEIEQAGGVIDEICAT
ncbi:MULTISPECIES: VRR-NUC domain-containing protein [unclassified Gemella]|uniref:VRR-NUC domain-containing protein n=1 Tax=unclassified Gemella TaxID=2624949 RepID=UPI001C03E320|nr:MULTISPECIES: VRR-NUC domain-containing protein [unclassified Gemella]MBU0278728.1 VRR-NUC domain-containing protein [Gemella sp. zg-1178]QWQ38671.1 VRR-NUC domain-containing protein [Gemella sp. zg-570]